MAQQPNVEATEATRPKPVLEPGPSARWRSDKPGVPAGPADVPSGSGFGHTGPDPGWALSLLANVDLPTEDKRLESVVIGLVQVRAAACGRAPVPEDIDVALVLCGYGVEASAEILERRERWLQAVPHESRPGETAAGEVDRDLIQAGPEQVRFAMRLSDSG